MCGTRLQEKEVVEEEEEEKEEEEDWQFEDDAKETEGGRQRVIDRGRQTNKEGFAGGVRKTLGGRAKFRWLSVPL